MKTVAASRVTKLLPFSSDARLREAYVNTFGDVRFGLVLEELDHVAGEAAHKHIGRNDLWVVTAAVDRIDLIHPVRIAQDLRFTAQVNYVGRTSLEVGIDIESRVEETWLTAAHAFFTMVAVNQNFVPTPIDPIVPETPEEKQVMEEAKKRKVEYQQSKILSLERHPPTEEESRILHDLNPASKQSRAVIPMSVTRLENTLFMHPQDKNKFGKVFGGYVMRTAYELAWSAAYKFCRERPLIASVDRINFEKPVEIGALVSFQALVSFVGRTSMGVEVVVKVINPKKEEEIVTHSGYFTLICMDQNRKPIPAPKVIPQNDEEALKYLEGCRRYRRNRDLRTKQKHGA